VHRKHDLRLMNFILILLLIPRLLDLEDLYSCFFCIFPFFTSHSSLRCESCSLSFNSLLNQSSSSCMQKNVWTSKIE
jgi:hypothetical protein